MDNTLDLAKKATNREFEFVLETKKSLNSY